MQTPFRAYYTAMKLNMLQDEDTLLPVFAEGNTSVYPYQVAAALFAIYGKTLTKKIRFLLRIS